MPNPEDRKPNWPAKPNYTSPLPKSSDSGKIPPRTQIHQANNLPHSPSPRPLKKEA
jgi:hypothetical protein